MDDPLPASPILGKNQNMGGEEAVLQPSMRALWLVGLRTENTRRAYLAGVEDFEASTGVKVEAADKQAVGLWILKMRERKLSEATMGLRLAALRSYLKWAGKGHQDVPLLSQARSSKGRAFSAQEIQDLLNQIDRNWVNGTGARDYALILGYVLIGRRNSEWRTARMDQFEQRDGKVYFRWSGKGHQDDLIEVPQALWEALTIYINETGGRKMYDVLFTARVHGHVPQRPLSERRVGQILKRYASMAGIEGRVRVHDLRHSAAMLRRQAGADVEELRAFLGHSSLATTQVYLHRMEGVSDRRGAQVMEMIGG